MKQKIHYLNLLSTVKRIFILQILYTFFFSCCVRKYIKLSISHQGCICHVLFCVTCFCCITLHVGANPRAESTSMYKRHGREGWWGGQSRSRSPLLACQRAAASLPDRCHHTLYESCHPFHTTSHLSETL